jgi:hypothetical protein
MTIAALSSICLASASPFPALHFGCNTTGPENATQLRELRRYAMPILEFRQGCCGGQPWTNAERNMELQAEALAAVAAPAAVGGKGTAAAWVYRNANAGSVFAQQRDFMRGHDSYFTGPPSVDPKYNISWRALNFSVPAAADWYLGTVVAEAAAEGAAVAGVFFDAIDCTGGSGRSARLYNDTLATFARACLALEAAGKGCILSTVNSFSSSRSTEATGCVLPEEAAVEVLHAHGLARWARYYQHWVNGFVGHKKDDSGGGGSFDARRCAAMVRNAVEESRRGIDIVARAPAQNSVYAVDLRVALAAFLMGASAPYGAGGSAPYGAGGSAAAASSSFGYGDCWFDECWTWQPLYDELGDIGAPLGPASVSDDGWSFSRSWTGVDVVVDCRHANASFSLRS